MQMQIKEIWKVEDSELHLICYKCDIVVKPSKCLFLSHKMKNLRYSTPTVCG